ncbi:MAG: ABC transporter permease subunit [Thermomicrobiales bacterium]|nr:ABC transporter permease subunit [Thermomicrobiales bacterium]
MLDSQYAQTQSLAAEETIARATPKTKRKRDTSAHSGLIEDILAHIALIVIAATVLFPVVWVVSMSLDGRNISRPTSLAIIPPNPSLDAYRRVLTEPQANNVMFSTMLKNSLLLSIGVSLVVVVFAVTAAYAFARFHFPGRKWGLFLFIAVLMLPSVATLAPLFVLLSQIKIPGSTESVRSTLFGVGIAYTSGALPFAIWNLRGYIDTLPKELEESALVDGANPNRAFFDVILPLIAPAIAITVLFGFMASWTEFVLAWTFLTDPNRFTLAMGLNGMVGQYSSNTPWSDFAALAILITLPILVLFFLLQRWIVSGLAVGAVKG